VTRCRCAFCRADRYARLACYGLFAFTALYIAAQIVRLLIAS
jgi:hypothetical protein